MKRKVILICLFLANSSLAALMSLKVRVVDVETRDPVQGLHVRVGFHNPPLLWGGNSHDVYLEHVSDRAGWCSFTGRSSSGECGFDTITTEGYYYGYGNWKLGDDAHSLPLIPHFHSTTVALYRVEHPIPLFVNEVSTRSFEDEFGDSDMLRYDLMKGDWMPPKGQGEFADVEFVRHPREELGLGTNGAGHVAMRIHDFMTVRFLGDGNGFVKVKPFANSALQVRTAPFEGYRGEMVCERTMNEYLQYSKSWGGDVCLCFRIRAKFDGNGNLSEAYYGKIYGGVKLLFVREPTVKIGGLEFRYYLNPTSLDRNLEYDGKHNLNAKRRRHYDYAP